MSLIPQYELAEFQMLDPEQVKQLKCCELMSGDEYVCTVIIPPVGGGMTITDHCRTQAEHIGLSGNSVGGKELTEIQ